MSERTIAAISTPAGEGAIGVIRISGENAISVADKIFKSISGAPLTSLQGYRAAYGEIYNGKEFLDNAVALVFRAPKSYTGEDVVEISVHGGALMLRSVLRTILENGAEPAAAGEFTKRAFLNGKLDLSKAESIMGLISAENEAGLKMSRAALSGKISQKISQIEKDITLAAASIAAYSDYPDEDIEDLSPENFGKMLNNAKSELKAMLVNYDAGKILREGITTAIVGKPNVGKSTLMNLLSGEERSIVTDVAGTTRDIVEETVTLGDITLRLADTAGIHTTDDKVESIGVEKAEQRIDTAQLILAVFDSTSPLDSDDLKILESIKDKNAIIIINKTDLKNLINSNNFRGFKTVEISAKSGNGYDELCNAVLEVSNAKKLKPDSAVLISERQRLCAQKAYNSISEALTALDMGCTMDAVGVCVDDALAALLELTGKRVTNEVSDEIFRRFCVGK